MEKRYLYGRHGGRITAVQRQALETLERWTVPLPTMPAVSLATFFAKPYARYAIEIGFGGGEHLLELARCNPDTGFIGIEPFRKGLAQVAVTMEAEGLGNIRLYPDAAQRLLPLLPAQSLAAVYVLFPDPWPKARHHKRRLVNPDFCREIARLLTPDGTLYMASDDADYQHQMLRSAFAAGYHWTARQKADWLKPFTPSITTTFQRRAMEEGRTCAFLRFSAPPIIK